MIVVSLLLASTAFAQESPSKQINSIKRNPIYLYAEATMDTPEEALSVARELLMQQVQEYVSANRFMHQAKDVLVKNVNAKSESLSMMRGTMFRVFVYVKKTDIEPVNNVTTINTDAQTSQEVIKQPVPPVSAPEQPIERPVEVVEETKAKQAEEISEPVIQKNETVSSIDLPVWQQQAIEDLLKCSNITEVRAMLNRMKAEYKIKRYGTPDKCPSASQAYWIIFDEKSNVVTVLGAGDSERIDFKNMTTTTLDNFKGMEALWFNFAK